MKVLIDADIPVYRMSWAVQKTHYQHKETGEFFDGIKKAKAWFKAEFSEIGWEWDIGEWNVTDELEPWEACKFLLDHCINGIMDKTGATEKALYLSPSKCFRHEIATVRPYKDKRRPAPFYKDKAREYLIERYGAIVGDNVEADDLLGLNQTTDTVIASIDKDLLSIPGRHYDIVKETKLLIDSHQADDMFFTQLLAGDSTDSIVGIPGIGMTGAVKIVDSFSGDHHALVEEIDNLYEDHYPMMGREIRDEMAQLVYILRSGDTPGNEQWRKLLDGSKTGEEE